MRSFSFYQVGNILIFLLIVMLLIGYLAGSRLPETEAEEELYHLLTNLEINLMGIQRTYDDILQGYSLIYVISSLFIVIFNIVLFKYLKTDLPLYRKVVILNILLWGIEMIIIIYYLALPPLIISGMILGSFLLAYFLIGKTSLS